MGYGQMLQLAVAAVAADAECCVESEGGGSMLKKQPRCLVEFHNCSDWKSRLEKKSLKQQGRRQLWSLVVVGGGWCVVRSDG